jgi:lauroyl/myristoyl acyltransferase
MSATNPHAPALNATARMLGRFHVTGVFWYQFPYWASRLPVWFEPFYTTAFTVGFFLALGRIRSAIASNLEPVLGKARMFTRWLRAFRTMHSFAWGLNERYRSFRSPELFTTTVEGEEHWREAMQSGRGVILVSAHIGAWEVSPRFAASAGDRRVHIIREREMDPRAQQFMRGLIERSGQQFVTHFAGEDPALTLELAEALQNGDIVAFQGDRPRAGGRTVIATMFGRPMPLPVGPAALARSTDVVMLPVFNFRAGRYRSNLVVRPALRVARTANREADVADAVHRLAAEIQAAIRRAPYQWFCFRQLW